MKLNIIENPRVVSNISKTSFSSILENKEMDEILGGKTECGVYTSCKFSGKSSCEPYSCSFLMTSCSETMTWALPDMLVNE
jgi:hypothetical protein